jgi:heptosyltransferase-2
MLLHDYTRIAIVQTAFLGDVALSLYLAQTLRNLHPTAHIGFVTTPLAAPLVESATAVNTVIAFDKRGSAKGWRGVYALAHTLSHYDCILAVHRSFRTSLVSTLSRIQAPRHSPLLTVGFDTASAAWLYDVRAPFQASLHEAERAMQILSVFQDVSTEALRHSPQPELHISTLAEEGLRRLLPHEWWSQPYIACAPGSVWATKRWREQGFVELLRNTVARGWRVVLVGSAADAALCQRIASGVNAAPDVAPDASSMVSESPILINAAGKTSLPAMLLLLKRASVLVCNDSAPLHLANLVGCPVVALFGPTVKEFGFAPRGERDVLLETSLPCRPCSPHGTHHCPLGTHECMHSIRAHDVAAHVQRLMNR